MAIRECTLILLSNDLCCKSGFYLWLGHAHLKAGGEGFGAILDPGVGRHRWRAPDHLATAARHRYVGHYDFRAPGGHDSHRLVCPVGGSHHHRWRWRPRRWPPSLHPAIPDGKSILHFDENPLPGGLVILFLKK